MKNEHPSEPYVISTENKERNESNSKTSFSEVSDIWLIGLFHSSRFIINITPTVVLWKWINHFVENTLSLQPTEEERTNLLRENRIFLTLTQRHDQLRKLWSIFSPILTLKNSILGWFSKKYISRKIPSEWTEGIVIDDDILKLHYNDNRRVTRDRVLDISE